MYRDDSRVERFIAFHDGLEAHVLQGVAAIGGSEMGEARRNSLTQSLPD